MGSKTRIAKHILPIILKNRRDNQCYVEPFVGGANMIDKVKGWRIGSDINYWLIEALKFIRDDTTPCDNSVFTEDHYFVSSYIVRNNIDTDMNHGLIGFSLFAYSFGGKWLGGWSRGVGRDYVAEQHRASIKQSPLLQGVELYNVSYKELKIPPQSIIYCDPPYANTTGYKDSFNHDEFWEWCRDKVIEGHQLFVSEYNAPDDFIEVWSHKLGVSVSKNGSHKMGVEKLFIHVSQI